MWIEPERGNVCCWAIKWFLRLGESVDYNENSNRWWVASVITSEFFTNKWGILIVLLSNSALVGILQLSMVKDSLSNKETRRKDISKDNAQVFIAVNRERSKSRDSKRKGRIT